MPVTKNQLAAHRGWVTRTLKSAALSFSVDNPPLPIIKQQRDELITRWKKYEVTWSKYEEENVDNADEREYKTELDAHEEKETAMNAMLFKLENEIAKSNTSSTPTNPSTTPTLGKLPEIHLPDFYGDLEKWPAFLGYLSILGS